MTLEELKAKAFEDPEVKKEYDRLAAEFRFIDQLLAMRMKSGLTQEQVAERMSTQKSNISRLESGRSNPSWATLTKYADACGFELSLASHDKA